MTVRDPKTKLHSSLVSLLLTSSLVGGAVACSFSEAPSVTQVPPTLSAQVPETPASPPDSIAFYYDGVKTSVTIKDAAVLFAACTLNTNDSTKIVNFVNNTLKAGPITAADVTGLGDPLKPAISDFTGDGVVNCNDAAMLFAAVTVGTDAAKINQFVSNTLKIPGINVTQTQLDSFFKPTPTPSSTPTPTPTPTPVVGLTLTPADFLGSNAINVFGGGVKSKTFTAVPVKPVEGGNLVINLNYSGTALVNVTPAQISFAPVGTPVPATITVTTQAGVNPVGTGEITFTVAGASTAKGFTPGEVLGKFALEVIDKAPPTPTPTGTPTPTTPGIIIEPPNLELEEAGKVTFTIKPAVAPVGGSFIVNVGPIRTGGTLGNISTSALPTIVSPPPTLGVVTLTFPAGITTPKTITIQGGNQNGNVVGAVGTATLEIQVAGGSTATNYPPTLDIPDPTITVTPTDFNVFFVDPVNGDDNNNGRASTPFKTLAGVLKNGQNPANLVQARANLGNSVTVNVINPSSSQTENLTGAIASGQGAGSSIGGPGDLIAGSITIIGPGIDSTSKYTLNLASNNLGLDKGVTLKNLKITTSGGSIQLNGGTADSLDVNSTANASIFDMTTVGALGGTIINSKVKISASGTLTKFINSTTLTNDNTLIIIGNEFSLASGVTITNAAGAFINIAPAGKGTVEFRDNTLSAKFTAAGVAADSGIRFQGNNGNKDTFIFTGNTVTHDNIGAATAVKFDTLALTPDGDLVTVNNNTVNIRGEAGAVAIDFGNVGGTVQLPQGNTLSTDGSNTGTGMQSANAVVGAPGATTIENNNTFLGDFANKVQ